MAQMIRKQIYIRKRQDSMLKKLARRRQVSEAELIREAIDQHTSDIGTRPSPSPPDPEAWERALGLMKALQAMGPLPNQRRTWKREDAYQDRMNRHERRIG